jgi:hypothetical protein
VSCGALRTLEELLQRFACDQTFHVCENNVANVAVNRMTAVKNKAKKKRI